jgi:hypothetical protein
VIEAAEGAQAIVEGALAGVPEGRVTEIVRKRERLGEVLIETKHARQRPRNLGDFERVGEPCPVVIAFVKNEDLRLVLETAEGGRVDDAVAVATERTATFAGRLRMQAPAASGRVAGIGSARFCSLDRHGSAGFRN